MRFLLGTHQVSWLADERFAEIPLFVSRSRLAKRKQFPRAVGAWALDSGGFTELQIHGRWTIDARTYASEVRRFRDEIGGLDWAAPQDWMCEPQVIAGARGFHGTGLSVKEHQRHTVDNLVELRTIAPDLPIIPVIQGWTIGDYWDCIDLYEAAGIDLRAEPVVGVGSVCRRQATLRASLLMSELAEAGIRLHGFGFKVQGLRSIGGAALASADSLAWSVQARKNPPLPGHHRPGPDRRTGHINCANCAEYALAWRTDLLDSLEMPIAAE